MLSFDIMCRSGGDILRYEERVSLQEEEGGQRLAEQVLCSGQRDHKILQEDWGKLAIG